MPTPFPKNPADKKQTVVFVIIISLLIIILFNFFIYPSLSEIKGICQEISNLKIKFEEANKGLGLKDSLSLYKAYQQKIELIDKSILTKNRELEFVTTLENIASQYNLDQKINLSKYEDIEGKSFFQMPLQIYLQGDFENELRYLQDIEKLNYYIDIEKINIGRTPGRSNPEKNLINMHIIARTYWQ